MKRLLLAAGLGVWAFFGCKTPVSTAKPAPDSASSGDEYEAYLERLEARFLGKPAPSFVLTDLQGNRYTNESLRGKVVLLNFWFKNCPPCQTEIASLNQLHTQYGSRGVILLAAGLDSPAELSAEVALKKILYRVSADGRALSELFQVKTYPTTYLIDREGVVKKVFTGASDWDATYTYTEVKPHLEQLLTK